MASYSYQLTQGASDPSKGTSLKQDKSERHAARFYVAALLSQHAAAAKTQPFSQSGEAAGVL